MENFETFVDISLSAIRNNELNEYRKTGQFSDLTLQTTDKQTMTVHKNVLSAACAYFRAMLKPEFIESRQNVIQLSAEVAMNDLEIIVEYLYTGTAKILTNNAKNLFIQAQFFNLVDLKNFCAKMLYKSLKIDNALELLRFSDKYKEDSLRDECLNFCTLNAEEFLKMSLFQLTYEELKAIIMADNLPITQEYLYTVLMDWCKHDFSAREKYLEEFVEIVDFLKISNEFIESVVLSDSVLHDNRLLLTRMAKLAFTRLKENIKKNQSVVVEEKATSTKKNKIKLNLITDTEIYELNWELKKWVEVLSFHDRGRGFSASTLNSDIVIAGGHGSGKKFESYQRSLNKMSECPPMLEDRYFHRSIQLNGNIYCCGGDRNNGSTEMFDPENSKWIARSKKRPSHSFGITSVENSIYTLGGRMNYQTTSIVEHYDPRIDKWTIISNDRRYDRNRTLPASIHLNDSIYCFRSIYEGRIFDIRTNKWNGSTSAVKEPEIGINYNVDSYDVTECNGEVYGVFQTMNNKTWGTFQYDHKENRWTDLGISMQLDKDSDTKLCSFDI